MADKKINLEDIDYEKYDFLDMGCGTADGYYHVKKMFGKHKGIGIDIDENKINEANEVISKNKELKENYLAVCDNVLNFSKLKLHDKFKFAVAIHFLEHLQGFDIAYEILYSALYASEEFVYVIEPFFDLDAELLKRGLKTYYSDWTDHTNQLTSLQFYRLGRDFIESDLITSFVIIGVEPIDDSSSPYILPIDAPVNSHEYDEEIHPPKNNDIKFKGLYKDIGVFFLKKDDIPIEKYMEKRAIKWSILYDSRIDYKENPFSNNDLVSIKKVDKIDADSNMKDNLSEVDLIENIRNHIVDDTIESYSDVFQVLKYNFVNQTPRFKTESFNNLKKLVYEAVVDYNQYEKIIADLNKVDRDFFEYILCSIDSDNKMIKKYQKESQLDIPISTVVYVKDNNKSELDNLYNSLVRQTIGIEHLEVIFIDNNSSNKETINHLEKLSEEYHNVKYIRLDNDFPKCETLNIALENITTTYVIFTDKEHILVNSGIKNIFTAIRNDNMNIAIGKTSIESNNPSTSIYSKLFKYDFIRENNIKIQKNQENRCVFNSEILQLNGILYTDVVVTKN